MRLFVAVLFALATAASAATPEWVWAYRRVAKTIPFTGKNCILHAELGERCWQENGHPGRAWRISMQHRWGTRHRIFVVDQPERKYLWCLSDIWCEETVRDEPITDAWNYAYTSGMGISVPGVGSTPDFPRRGRWTVTSKTEVLGKTSAKK